MFSADHAVRYFEQDVPWKEGGGYDLYRITVPQCLRVFCTKIPTTLRLSKSSY